MRGTPAWSNKLDLLKSVPGIGPVIARALIAELSELGMLDRRKIANLAGLGPINGDSGSLRGRRAIAGSRGTVRAALDMAVMVAIRRKTVAQSEKRTNRGCEDLLPSKGL